VQAAVREAEAGATKFVENHDAYLERMKGLVWGDNPEQGIVRGSTFLHPGLRFAIDFPRGWDLTNGQTQVVAKEPGTTALMLLQPVRRPEGRTIEDIAVLSMQRAGLRALEGSVTTIGGLNAYLATYAGSTKDLGTVTVRAAHIAVEHTIYLVAGLAPDQDYSRAEPSFTAAIKTFRAMTRAQAEDVHPNRIDLYTARRGDTWQGIAERTGSLIKPTTLAIMNGHAVNDPPRTGERLKVVVSG